MPLPDPYANEPTVEVPEDLWRLWQEYEANASAWKREADKVKSRIIEHMGEATAVLVAGAKVASYRPTARYAEARLVKDYPDLSQHYFREEVRNVFDMDLFAKMHPDIAEQYRVRSFNRLETP